MKLMFRTVPHLNASVVMQLKDEQFEDSPIALNLPYASDEQMISPGPPQLHEELIQIMIPDDDHYDDSLALTKNLFNAMYSATNQIKDTMSSPTTYECTDQLPELPLYPISAAAVERHPFRSSTELLPSTSERIDFFGSVYVLCILIHDIRNFMFCINDIR